MKRLFARPRSMLLVVALAVVAAMCTAPTARAASPGGSTGNAAVMSTAASPGTVVSDAQCNFRSGQTCQSADPTITVSTDQYGDTSACTFVWNVDWGDGHSTLDLVLTDPPDGWRVLAQHTYATPGTYTILLTGEVMAGNCTLTPFSRTFTLLPAPPPTPKPSPKISWSQTSGRPGKLVTLTGKGWVPQGIVQVHFPEKKLFIGITSWRVDSHGNWKESLAVGDAPPGTYKVGFSEASGHLKVTDKFTVVDPPNLLERFSNWVDACLHGKLDVDPMCKDALDEEAHLKLSVTSILSCIVEIIKGPKEGIAACIRDNGIAVGTWVYNTFRSWWAHKPGP